MLKRLIAFWKWLAETDPEPETPPPGATDAEKDAATSVALSATTTTLNQP